MRKLIYFILTAFLFLIACKENQNEVCKEVEEISNKIEMQNRNVWLEIMENAAEKPKRYKESYQLYYNLQSHTTKFISLINELIETENFKNNNKKRQELIEYSKHLSNLIDEIYLPRIHIVNYSDTALKNYRLPLNDKVSDYSTVCDLKMMKLYIRLIESEVVNFLHRTEDDWLYYMNVIEPLTVMKDGYINCYITAIDTCLFPFIVIGKFKEIFDEEGFIHYSAIEVKDTILFKGTKVTFDKNLLRDNDAILYYQDEEGGRVEFKLDNIR
jgi:hypothetical protein